MQVVLSAALGLGRFLYRFVVGDDWRVAVAMLAALAATALLVRNQIQAWWLVPVVAIAMTGISLWRSRNADLNRARPANQGG
jgi:branched-subunit amino acid transport protein